MNRIQERREARETIRDKKTQMYEGEELSALAVRARQV